MNVFDRMIEGATVQVFHGYVYHEDLLGSTPRNCPVCRENEDLLDMTCDLLCGFVSQPAHPVSRIS
jgi:hypothetical protein